MVFIFASGTRFAVLTAAWSILIACPALAEQSPSGNLEIQISGLRNSTGTLHVCVSSIPAAFPQCRLKGRVRSLSVPASAGQHVTIPALPPGIYAVSLFHDENSNGKLDTFLGVPREGFAFSNNPPITIGPPTFARSSFVVPAAGSRQHLHIRYML